MKKISTVGARQTRNFREQGLDLGDRSSWYCVLDEGGEVLLEQRLGTTPKAMKEVFGDPASPNDSGRAEIENLDSYKRFLILLLGPRVERLLLDANHPAPVIFKSYLDVLETALKIALRVSFKEMFEIAKARTDLLGMHPVEWAKRHLQILISDEKGRIRVWIKEVCDPLDLSRSAFTDDAIFWESWRAPRLIHMKPAGNTFYEQARTWMREELVESEELVEPRAELSTDFLRIDLDEVARLAHVEFAKQDSARVRVPRQEDSSRGIPTRRTPPLVPGTQPPDVWRSLHETFRGWQKRN
jgi:hypothetical protein